jgi:hypothetical protein
MGSSSRRLLNPSIKNLTRNGEGGLTDYPPKKVPRPNTGPKPQEGRGGPCRTHPQGDDTYTYIYRHEMLFCKFFLAKRVLEDGQKSIASHRELDANPTVSQLHDDHLLSKITKILGISQGGFPSPSYLSIKPFSISF